MPNEKPKPDEPLITCRARLIDKFDLAPPRVALVVSVFVIAVTVAPFVLSRHSMPIGPCMFTFVTPAVVCCLVLYFRLFAPEQRGLLHVYTDRLWFVRDGKRDVELPFSEILRIGRRGRRVHVARRRGRDLYFVCPRLVGEDVYDQLSSRLHEIGHAHVDYEVGRGT